MAEKMEIHFEVRRAASSKQLRVFSVRMQTCCPPSVRNHAEISSLIKVLCMLLHAVQSMLQKLMV